MQFLYHTNNLISKHFQYRTRVIALDCFSNVNKVHENGNPPSGNHTVTTCDLQAQQQMTKRRTKERERGWYSGGKIDPF